MADTTAPDTQTDAELQQIRDRLTRTSRKLCGMETSLRNLRRKHDMILRELRLSSSAERERAEAGGGVITRMMDQIMEIRDIFDIIRTTFQEIYANENKIAERLISFHEGIISNHEKLFFRLERFRILAQLGELDSKLLTLRFNGIRIPADLGNDVLHLRSTILTSKDIPVEELQESSLELFRRFADCIEEAIEGMCYQPGTREILESMREVSWM